MVIVEWCHKYGIPHSVRSDGRGSFRSRSIEKLKEMRVEHTHTSLYNSEANDGCERAIRDGVRKMTKEVLDIITFGINNQAQDDAGSAAERFFGRAPRTFLPSSLERYVVHQQLIERRKQKHIEISRRKGRSSPSDYKPGEKVHIQDHVSKRWNIQGVISGKRMAEDGTSRSFTLETMARNSYATPDS